MQISNRNDGTNFTSTPVRFVNLKNRAKTGDRFVKAVLTKLDPNDADDLGALKMAIKNWKAKHSLGDDFLNKFEAKSRDFGFNAVELISEKPLAKRIVGLVSTSIDDLEGISLFSLETLFAKPNLTKRKWGRKISGIGEIMLAEAIFKAKQANSLTISFTSSTSALEFYTKSFKKAGIELTKKNYIEKMKNFWIENKDFDKYLKYIEKEYDMNFSATI